MMGMTRKQGKRYWRAFSPGGPAGSDLLGLLVPSTTSPAVADRDSLPYYCPHPPTSDPGRENSLQYLLVAPSHVFPLDSRRLAVLPGIHSVD
jgi:hypothetical protein